MSSPRAHYALTSEVLEVVKTYKTRNWKNALKNFIDTVGKLSEVYLKERELIQIPVVLQNGEILKLSAGKHNEVQAAIVEQFAPRFANGGTLLYLGDTAKKDLFVDEKGLKDLGIRINNHTHWQAPQANAQTKAYQSVCLCHPEKKKLKISFPSKNFKNANPQTDTKTIGQLVAKLNIDKGCKTRF